LPDSQDAAAIVELRGVCKSYGLGKDQVVRAADDVSLTAQAGAFMAVTGASGSGKSTLLHLIGAMERPDGGTILSRGRTSPRCADGHWRHTGAPSASCSSGTTCCRRSPRWTT
jgi:ABC-type lipoprotein export system ATPase subunit